MSALAIFHCRPNSHPFQERHIPLQEACKIGRSVARARPAPNNAIFDCKVLSRNHALLWYEDGVFYLQDTKSSNGTFVNNQRLSKGSEESPARQIFSGDVVQFGVDVMENSRRVTHGCIIASVSLFHPDGREVKPSHSNAFGNQTLSPGGTPVQSQELYQLAQYLQEALHREQMLENKLATLQRLVHETQESSESGWQALIDEDRLLSRLEVLENQLLIYSKNQTEDSLRQELIALTEDKSNYETTAKESLRRVLQEKLEAVRKLSELERSLSNTEDECSHLKKMCESSQNELEELAKKHETSLQDLAELQNKLQEAELKYSKEEQNVEREKAELQEKIESMEKEKELLSAKVESLQADSDFTKEQLNNMKARMEAMKEQNIEGDKIIDTETHDVVEVDVVPDNESSEDKEDNLKEKLRAAQEEIEKHKALLEESDFRLKESQETVKQLQVEFENAQQEASAHLSRMALIEEKLALSDIQSNRMVDSAVSDIETQLNVSNKQREGTDDLIRDLKDQISNLEEELKEFRLNSSSATASSPSSSVSSTTNSHDITNRNVMCILQSEQSLANSRSLSELDQLKELLTEARDSQRKTESELERCKCELEQSQSQVKTSADEAEHLKNSLSQVEQEASQQTRHANHLQEQLHKAEATTRDVKEQILVLREHLQDAQQAAKQSHNEAEQLRTRVRSLQEELELEKISHQNGTERETTHTEIQKQAAKNKVEFTSLKEECASLRARIAVVEEEMKVTRREKIRLVDDYEHLQESYRELEAVQENLKSNETTWKINLTDAQKDAQQTKQELIQANNELAFLKDRCAQYGEEITQVRGQLDSMTQEYELLSDKSKAVSLCSVIPILILLFAIIVAFYQPLADITATSSLT